MAEIYVTLFCTILWLAYAGGAHTYFAVAKYAVKCEKQYLPQHVKNSVLRSARAGGRWRGLQWGEGI